MNGDTSALPSPALQRVKKLLAGVEDAVALAQTSPSSEALVLRGIFCLCVSGLEVYFTYSSTDIMFDHFVRSAGSGDAADLVSLKQEYKRSLKRLGCRKVKATESDVTDLRSAIYGDFSSVTINRAAHISTCVDLLAFPRACSPQLWFEAAEIHGRYSPAQFTELLSLIVERRNRIMHYGDFELLGAQTYISARSVLEAARCIAVVTETADQMTAANDKERVALPELTG